MQSMRIRRVPAGLALGVALASLAAPPRAAAAPPPREKFPSVTLSSFSDPRYGVIQMDPFTNHLGYVLFDGNVKEGYDKMFLWVPGDAKYGRAVPFMAQR